MDPLLSNGKLKKEGTKKEGKHMLQLSVREHVHNNTKRIAHEKTESVVDGLAIKTSGLGKTFNIIG